MQKNNFLLLQKVKKYRKCPAHPSQEHGGRPRIEAARSRREPGEAGRTAGGRQDRGQDKAEVMRAEFLRGKKNLGFNV